LKKAIYLSGGGARTAYQAGVLKGIQTILNVTRLPVEILSSVSAGSINASYLAMNVERFDLAVEGLAKLWSSLSSDKIYKVSHYSLIKSIIRNAASFISHYQPKEGGHFLDTTPLKQFLDTHLDFKQINKNIDSGLLDFEVTASCYDTAETTSFINSSKNSACWQRVRHRSRMNSLSCDHILASSAIPLFFPSVSIDGLHYGDGGLRLASPLRASIKLGADNILVIGTRILPPQKPCINQTNITHISFAKMLGNMLNALFLDNLDRDIELITKINKTVALLPKETRHHTKWKHINVFSIRPSIDIGEIAKEKYNSMPFFLRYLMGTFGSKAQSGDFLSFLLFESEFSNALLELGYNDALTNKEQILTFFNK
jgi:NTE family protein